ncbi:unnamed protein product (macronuclear) [Paramecium tetraurelia]|uniref:Uncharacterized protein n=1 Tax=Paramecium tetraurelia TaxID=5888 RepID=A0BF59_PARTE|nr:uncharacterized protein GSPATT00028211001 [Paramecium tetraurelia]CAK57176.1 unnamed protein product [Paramecium tetraurelia]|eukprot:XP_001424574.1 hypothetical protein (macronuclear) [Paramecium tetraurelia strain d4-2]
MFQAEKGANAIPGYTGQQCLINYALDSFQVKTTIKTYCKFKATEIISQVHCLCLCHQDYAGFVPGIKSENLFGKTFGKITLLSSTHEHHRGSDLPADIRYKSEVKEAYCDQRDQRGRDIDLYGKLDSETSKALAYTLSNLTHFEQTNTLPKRSDSKDRQSNLTYEEALQKLK